MKDFFQKLLKLRKHLLTMLLTSNLILVSTGSAVLNLSPSPTPQVATPSAKNVDPSPSVIPSMPSTFPNNSEVKKIDPTGKFIEDEIVIRYKTSVSENEKTSLALENETEIEKDLPYSKLKILRVDPAKREKTIEKLKNNPKVDYIGPNYATRVSSVPNDPSYPQQWHLSKINAPNVWNQHTGSSNVKIAEVDSGINYNLAAEFDLVENGGRIIKGRDAYNRDNDPMDDFGHGTRVAGVMGAKTNNGVDVAAVDWNAQIIAVKVLGSNGTGGSAELAEGLQWLVDNNPDGLKVVNLSMSVGSDDPNVRSAIETLVNRGILVVVGVYNSSPGNWNCVAMPLATYPGVIAVVAIDENDSHWSGCTLSTQDHLIAAPGHNIWTESAEGGAIQVSGTSYATPQVSGAASILFSCPNNPTAASVRYSLLTNASALGAPGFDAYGWGRLDMFSAMQNEPGCNTPPMGDVDCSGTVDSVDALKILRYTAGLITSYSLTCPIWEPYEIYMPQADVNGNGVVDSTDALYVLQIVSGTRSAQTQSLVPPAVDSDGDGMTDQEESAYSCLNPNAADANADFDGERLTNIQEIVLGTNLCASDSDGDGADFSDYVEFYVGTKPLEACSLLPADDAWPPDFRSNASSTQRDGLVSGVDLIPLKNAFGSVQGDAKYNRRADLNADGKISGLDLIPFKRNFGRSCK